QPGRLPHFAPPHSFPVSRRPPPADIAPSAPYGLFPFFRAAHPCAHAALPLGPLARARQLPFMVPMRHAAAPDVARPDGAVGRTPCHRGGHRLSDPHPPPYPPSSPTPPRPPR